MNQLVEYDAQDILSLDEASFKATIVQLILLKDTEKAVELVSRKFKVRAPSLGIGHTKGKKTALAVYSVAANTISFSDQDQYFNPFVVLHEMYHCVRSTSGHHRGTERNADKFALDYIEEFNKKLIALGYGIPVETNSLTSVDDV
ncbi:MAG: hypothetical protein OK439_03455 [Thaumarchaeota archaeon]|nr:hypothetical protein [Nitrososphaerota archaeon]